MTFTRSDPHATELIFHTPGLANKMQFFHSFPKLSNCLLASQSVLKTVLLLLTCCLLLLPLWESVIVLCFVVRYFMSIQVLQSSWWGRDSWLLCLVCLPSVSWLLCGSSSWCHGLVCRLWLWHFLIILVLTHYLSLNNILLKYYTFMQYMHMIVSIDTESYLLFLI